MAASNTSSQILNSPVEYLTGITAVKGDLLRKELGIFNFKDLLEYYPFRHIDKTRVDKISSIGYTTEYAQVAGSITGISIQGEKRNRRLVVQIKDETGVLELVWFQGIHWVEKMLVTGNKYLVFGKTGFFNGKPQMAHPEIEQYSPDKAGGKSYLEPIYSSTEKLKARGLNGRAIGKFTFELLGKLTEKELPENLPGTIISRYKLISRFEATRQIHFPSSMQQYQHALRRLKFEELFLAQWNVQLVKLKRQRFSKGHIFSTVGTLFNEFYEKHLPFPLTEAQKRVLKEIRKDTASGHQMNRLLQGDVGSGKTIVALLSMLISADNRNSETGDPFQSLLMAPTEILAQQHYTGICELLKELPVTVMLLTGSTKTKERKKVLEACADGSLTILIGTHAIIEDHVQFSNLGFAVVDEQHKFGVAQRAKLWSKNKVPPHILVMTATPIPRTLALTAYGDLDYSVIDELPPGRKPVNTVHRYEHARPQVMDFIKQQLAMGRQAYIIYPLIEESSKVDYENLIKGYEEVKSFFPEPAYWISMVHGKQEAGQKETNMQRFVKGDTHIMVSTTVIEVGVNVPNASVMVIESAEKFGLSQLHQLRGRVGRGAEQSYCILLTGQKLSADARERINIMVQTNDGFLVAEKDLELRGPGEMEGTRQSGALHFKLADIVQDKAMLEAAKLSVEQIIETDPELLSEENSALKNFLLLQKGKTVWSRIS